MKHATGIWLAVFAFVLCGRAVGEPSVRAVLTVDRVWAGQPVGFDMLTHKGRQFVAYYDAERHMTVAARRLGETTWDTKRLPSRLGWDSHNYITMIVDRDDRLHLSGNMHGDPLVYFRTREPLAIDTFERVEAMVGRNEERCTYPRFFEAADGALLFMYRDGKSGQGARYINRYDTDTQSWRRLLDTPLLDGLGKVNAYPVGPVKGPDGWFHLCWVWRETPDCATNHHLCYARSRDLIEWQSGSGRLLSLPMTPVNADVVDPVPVRGGMLNGHTRIGFDHGNRVILSYHKFDESGNTQIYNARLEENGWKIYQTSDWSYRWEFSGGGTIQTEISVGSVTPRAEELLTLYYRHPEAGSGHWILDPGTLKPTGKWTPPRAVPRGFGRHDDPPAGMHTRSLSNRSDTGDVRFLLRWHTLPSNRDRPREGPPPEPTTLKLYELIE